MASSGYSAVPVHIRQEGEDVPAVGVLLLGGEVVVGHQPVEGSIDPPGVGERLPLRLLPEGEVRLAVLHGEAGDVIGRIEVAQLPQGLHADASHLAVPDIKQDDGPAQVLLKGGLGIVVVMGNQGIATFLFEAVHQAIIG